MAKTNKTIQQLIAEVKENNLTKIDFRDSEELFEVIPDEVYGLTYIEEFRLGFNQVKTISKKISGVAPVLTAHPYNQNKQNS